MDAYHKLISFEPGDFILLLTKHPALKLPGSYKLKPLWVGPYQIVCACSNNAYKLELHATLVKLHPLFNFTLLKHYVGNVVPTLDPIKLDNGAEYEVDAILHHQWAGLWHTHLEYLVSFVGYDASHNEWLPAAN